MKIFIERKFSPKRLHRETSTIDIILSGAFCLIDFPAKKDFYVAFLKSMFRRFVFRRKKCAWNVIWLAYRKRSINKTLITSSSSSQMAKRFFHFNYKINLTRILFPIPYFSPEHFSFSGCFFSLIELADGFEGWECNNVINRFWFVT